MNQVANEKRKALGRGLDSLLPAKSAPAQPSAAQPASAPANPVPPQEISVDLIDSNPYQTRRKVDPETLNELVESIRTSGVVQPIVVRPVANNRFQLVAGERRWQASKRAGKASIPAVVRHLSNEQALEITIVENLQREDLNPMEQARAFERLSQEFGLTQEQIAARTGKERASVANFLRLLKLPESLQDSLEAGALSFGHGKVLLALVGFPELLERATKDVVDKALSVRQTEGLVAKLLNPESAQNKMAGVATTQDPNVREAQRSLERALGVKVDIRDHHGKGKIILKYGSLEDFDRIVESLGHSLH